jgi:hypothetical protein
MAGKKRSSFGGVGGEGGATQKIGDALFARKNKARIQVAAAKKRAEEKREAERKRREERDNRVLAQTGRSLKRRGIKFFK